MPAGKTGVVFLSAAYNSKESAGASGGYLSPSARKIPKKPTKGGTRSPDRDAVESRSDCHRQSTIIDSLRGAPPFGNPQALLLQCCATFQCSKGIEPGVLLVTTHNDYLWGFWGEKPKK